MARWCVRVLHAAAARGGAHLFDLIAVKRQLDEVLKAGELGADIAQRVVREVELLQ